MLASKWAELSFCQIRFAQKPDLADKSLATESIISQVFARSQSYKR